MYVPTFSTFCLPTKFHPTHHSHRTEQNGTHVMVILSMHNEDISFSQVFFDYFSNYYPKKKKRMSTEKKAQICWPSTRKRYKKPHKLLIKNIN